MQRVSRHKQAARLNFPLGFLGFPGEYQSGRFIFWGSPQFRLNQDSEALPVIRAMSKS